MIREDLMGDGLTFLIRDLFKVAVGVAFLMILVGVICLDRVSSLIALESA